MATANAAELVDLSREIGSLEPGHAADLMVLRKSELDAKHDAYWVITHSGPRDLELVVIGGRALYGDPAMMEPFAPASSEKLQMCGTEKELAVGGESFAGRRKRWMRRCIRRDVTWLRWRSVAISGRLTC